LKFENPEKPDKSRSRKNQNPEKPNPTSRRTVQHPRKSHDPILKSQV